METDDSNSNGQLVFSCPHCRKDSIIKIKFACGGVDPLNGEPKPALGLRNASLENLSREQKDLILAAHKTGIIKIFDKCVRIVKSDQIPNSMDKYFVTIMRTCVQKAIPRFALDLFRKKCTSSNVELWTSQGIGILVSNGLIRSIIPVELVFGKSFSGGNGKAQFIQKAAEPEELEQWLNENIFSLGQRVSFSQTHTKALGGLANPVIA